MAAIHSDEFKRDAVRIAVLNAMWYEMLENDDQHSQAKSVSPNQSQS